MSMKTKGRLSAVRNRDGSGQHNPDRSEGLWGRAAQAVRVEVFQGAACSGTERGVPRWQR